MKFRNKIFLSVVCSLLANSLLAQSLKQLQLNKNQLVIQSIDSRKLSKPLSLVSYRINGELHLSAETSHILQVSFNPEAYNFGIRGKIVFKNISQDTVKLDNVVPLGESPEEIYITGRGDHPLSRTYLFRPGYVPVNVIVPDNAWELGFTATQVSKGLKVAALVRRERGSLQKGSLRRFVTTLYPDGSITYNFWMDKYKGEWQEGLRMVFQQRMLYDVPVGQFDDSLLNRKDLKWIRNCYAANLMMCWDRRFYDYKDHSYHVQDFLERMKKLMGGYDVYGIWPTWPALGMDQRTQWDMFQDLPGGFPELRKISDLCHKEGAHFFLSYNPWDKTTRDGEKRFAEMTRITKDLDVDGFVLDTQSGSSKVLQDAVDAARPSVVMYSEGMATPKEMQGIVSGRVHNALYYAPLVNLNKFIRPDFAIFRVAEEAREPIRREFNMSFFNGYGTEINSFPPGKFNWSDDQLRYWGSLLIIQRANAANFQQISYGPLIQTTVDSIYVNKWPGAGKTIYTVYNLHPQGFSGNLFEIEKKDSAHLVDLFHHEEVKINEVNGKSYVPVQLDAFNKNELGTNNESSVTAIGQFPDILSVDLQTTGLTFSADRGTKILIWAGAPSYQNQPKEYTIQKQTICLPKEFESHEGKFVIQAFEGSKLIDERVLIVTPGTAFLTSKSKPTKPLANVPQGMVVIPGGVFSCDQYITGDSFIPYPSDITKKGERVKMKKFFMDQFPVTNADFKKFLEATHYVPADTTNFLKNWKSGRIPPGEENFPVVYVTLEDAKAYTHWAGKRLPTEMEWQYAAQTEKGNEWPWTQKKPVKRVEEPITSTLSVYKLEGIEKDRCNLGDGKLYEVGKYPKGKNAYGLYDLSGCVWQLTNDEYDNGAYRYIMVKGGSYFRPSSSWWYVQGGPKENNFRQYLLRVSPSFERKATVGFRCVKDAIQK